MLKFRHSRVTHCNIVKQENETKYALVLYIYRNKLHLSYKHTILHRYTQMYLGLNISVYYSYHYLLTHSWMHTLYYSFKEIFRPIQYTYTQVSIGPKIRPESRPNLGTFAQIQTGSVPERNFTCFIWWF